MDAIIEHMTTAPLWSGNNNINNNIISFNNINKLFFIIFIFIGESEEGYISIRDCLEKYILTKIGNYAFQSVECPEDDAFLLKRMKLLSFIQTKVYLYL